MSQHLDKQAPTKLQLYFRPQLTNALINLFTSLRMDLAKYHHHEIDIENLRLRYYRLSRLLTKLSGNILPQAMPCYRIRTAKSTPLPHIEIACTGMTELLACLRAGPRKGSSSLSVSGINEISQQQQAISKTLPRLFTTDIRRLTISNSTVDVAGWFRSLNGLLQLSLCTYCSNLSVTSAKAVAVGVPFLRKMTLIALPGLTDEKVLILAQGSYQLKELNINDSGQVTARIIEGIAKGCRYLTSLSINLNGAQVYSATKQDLMTLVGFTCPLSITLHSTVDQRPFWNNLRVCLPTVQHFYLRNRGSILRTMEY